jgi:DNA mismatch endonuclease (patch repair protein)
MDNLTPERRSQIMALVRSKHTGPEMIVRKLVTALGRRYRLHAADLPGRPDLVFHGDRKIIEVRGCMWHMHGATRCKLARIPKSRPEFWLPKLDANRRRDTRNVRALRRDGWRVLTIWECQLRDLARLGRRVEGFLNA